MIPNLAALGVSAPIARDSYPPIDQGGIIIKASTQKAAASEFMAFLKTPSIVGLLQRFGFEVRGNAARP